MSSKAPGPRRRDRCRLYLTGETVERIVQDFREHLEKRRVGRRDGSPAPGERRRQRKGLD